MYCLMLTSDELLNVKCEIVMPRQSNGVGLRLQKLQRLYIIGRLLTPV